MAAGGLGAENALPRVHDSLQEFHAGGDGGWIMRCQRQTHGEGDRLPRGHAGRRWVWAAGNVQGGRAVEREIHPVESNRSVLHALDCSAKQND